MVKGVSTFRLSQFSLDRTYGLKGIPLQTIVVQKGKFKNGRCEFDDKKAFKPVEAKCVSVEMSDHIEALHGRAKFGFGVKLPITSITLKVKEDQCLNLVASTGLACCSVSKSKTIEMKERCEISDE